MRTLNNKVLAILSLIVVIGLSCAHAEMNHNKRWESIRICDIPDLVLISPDIPKEWIPIIVNSVKYWNQTIGKRIFFYGGIAPYNSSFNEKPGYLLIDTATIEQMSTWENQVCGLAQYDKSVKGCLISTTILIKENAIDAWKDLNRFETLIRHELGHALGLGHSKVIEDLMYDTIIKDIPHPRNAHPYAVERVRETYGETFSND